MTDHSDLFRRLPRMDDLLEHPRLQAWRADEGCSRDFLREAATHVLDALRESIADGSLGEEDLGAFLEAPHAAVERAAESILRPHLRPVVNGTGVVVHTNLGRSPWSPAAARRVAELASRYGNLEFDLSTGGRGGREEAIRGQVRRLLPGSDVALVNNCAAALLLVLNTFAQDREVIVSRGQLVEIGGSFRVPDVMEKGFCRLREVGTTNRTRLNDYAGAVGADTGLILTVHPSNYRVVGFTEETELGDLVALGAESDVPVVEDLGSGNLIDLAAYGIDEPSVAERLATGVTLVTFSGDKLLGGPQAGFIVGDPDAVARCRSNPLYRAMLLDKGTMLALEATLADYVAGRYDAVPTLRMLALSAEELRPRADALCAMLADTLPDWSFEVVAVDSRAGGGAAPEVALPSWGVALQAPEATADEISERLRAGDPAIVGRIVDDRLLFDVRTLLEGDEDRIRDAVCRA